jgi:hypothetical protein
MNVTGTLPSAGNLKPTMKASPSLACEERGQSINMNMYNLVPRACDPREGTRGSGIIRCRKLGILAKTELRIPYQRPIRFLPETDYPRASRSLPRIAGSGNEIGICIFENWLKIYKKKAF